ESVMLDGLDLADFRHQLPEPGLDALLEGDGGGGAAVAGAAEPEQQQSLHLVEVHDLDGAAMRTDVGPEGVEGLFDPLEEIRARSWRGHLVRRRSWFGPPGQRLPFPERYSRAA